MKGQKNKIYNTQEKRRGKTWFCLRDDNYVTFNNSVNGEIIIALFCHMFNNLVYIWHWTRVIINEHTYLSYTYLSVYH